MKQFTVLSGKGGTGKTTITAALASIAESKILADCDVDAANLHLLLDPRRMQSSVFEGGSAAVIDSGVCDACGVCRELCRFGAISEDLRVDEISCEGCGVCVWNCPKGAISLVPDRSGEWYVSQTRFGTLVHARLGAAQENSGKLVSIIRSEAKRLAEEGSKDLVLIDGPPGVSCPAMASLTGTDAALIVTEPTMSGLHDLERVAKLLRSFKIPGMVCINKEDLHPEQAALIRDVCPGLDLEMIGGLPFDPEVPKSLSAGKTVFEMPPGPVSEGIVSLWDKIRRK